MNYADGRAKLAFSATSCFRPANRFAGQLQLAHRSSLPYGRVPEMSAIEVAVLGTCMLSLTIALETGIAGLVPGHVFRRNQRP
jgi:hypothetical protein